MHKPDEFLKKMVEEGKIIKNDSKFHIHNRIESWQKQAPNYLDRDLDKFKAFMLKVFNEEDPQYELEKDKRMLANIYGKKLKYSEDARKGMAIFLALVGNYNDLLENCSPSKRKMFVSEILKDVFVDMSWQRFATLNSALPFFAEADPDSFLFEINQLADNKKIIKDLVADEGDILLGGYHWTGLMEALEVLAWGPKYLPSVIQILAKLTLLDNDRNIYPRPKDTLMRIFVPWYIQTTTASDKLVIILKDLAEKYPELVWDILISCLNTHVNTMKHRVPEIRKDFAPSIEQTSSINYEVSEKLTSEYKKIMLGMASEHIDFTKKLVQSFGIFKESPFFEEALQILSSSMVLNSSDDVKEHMWSELGKIYCLHNRHKTDSWVIPQEKISKLLEVQMLLQPESIFFQKKHLFDRKVSDWYETNDFAAEESKYFERHTETVKEIFSNYGLAGIFSLSHLIEVPEWLGSAVKKAGITINNLMIKNLPTDSDEKIHYLISGYLQRCFIDKKEEWLNSFIDEEWSDNKKYMLLSCLPFTSVVWHFAEKWMYDESKYWKNINVSVIGHEPDSVYAIEKSLKYDRPDLAVNCIAWSLYFKIETDFNLCVKALKKLVELNLITKADRWHITQIIINLQGRVNNDEEKKELVLIEFLFLPLLDMSGDPKISPATLNHVLATDPAFFQEIIGFLYKSNKGIATPETSQAYFENAYRLLSQWNVVPGLNSEGNFEYSVFLKWYEKTLELCEQSGHLNIAKLHIGNVLFYVPEDKDGLWINKDIASLLNKEENNTLREGYFQETINSRSFGIVDFSGKKDFDRAKEFHDKAQSLEEFGFSNFAETLRLLAKDSEKDAERNINEGKIRNQKEEL